MAESYSIRRDGNDVHLHLRGHFTGLSASASTEEFGKLVGTDQIRFIVHISELEAYDKEARQLWQKVLAPMSKQISMIVFVGDAPPLIRMAASMVALAVGVRMRFVDDVAGVAG